MEPFLNNLYAEVSFGCVNSVVISAYRLANGDRRQERINVINATDVEKDSFANMPLVIGFVDNNFNPPFNMQFEPNHMLGVIASKLLDNNHQYTDLKMLVERWKKKVPVT